jgi:hypothetical protein
MELGGGRAHCNAKDHFETEPLSEDWVHKNPTRIHPRKSDGTLEDVDAAEHYADTWKWGEYYDKAVLVEGQPTDTAIRAMVTFAKATENLGKKPCGIARTGKFVGFGYDPKPAAAMEAQLITFIFNAENWTLHPVSSPLAHPRTPCAHRALIPCSLAILAIAIGPTTHGHMHVIS